MFVSGDYARGVKKCLRQLTAVLGKRAREAERDPMVFTRRYMELHEGIGLKSIREDHRMPDGSTGAASPPSGEGSTLTEKAPQHPADGGHGLDRGDN